MNVEIYHGFPACVNVTDEKSLYADSRFALWTSSYGTRYYQATDSDIPAVRQVVFQNDMLFVFSYDIIGKGNVRGILAF